MRLITNKCPRCDKELQASITRHRTDYYRIYEKGRIRTTPFMSGKYHDDDWELELVCINCDLKLDASFDPTGNFAEVDDVAWKEALAHAQRAG